MSWLFERWRAVAILGLILFMLAVLPPTVRWFHGGTQKFFGSRRGDALELRYPILWRIGGIASVIPIIGLFLLLGRLKGAGLAFGVVVWLALVALALVGNLSLWATRFLVGTNSIVKITIARRRSIAFSEVRSVVYVARFGRLAFHADAKNLDVPIELDGFGEFAGIVLATLPQFIANDPTRLCLESFNAPRRQRP